jgi:hypothetical protein
MDMVKPSYGKPCDRPCDPHSIVRSVPSCGLDQGARYLVPEFDGAYFSEIRHYEEVAADARRDGRVWVNFAECGAGSGRERILE